MRGLRLVLIFLLPLLVSASPISTIPLGNDVCLDDSSIPTVATTLNVDVPMTGSTASSEKQNLPVFFFHGLTGNSTEGFNYQRNLTAEGRIFVPLAFCERECSLTALNIQVPMAIAAVREVVTNDERFANGYIFIGHSQGAMMARAVIEQMDDHKVHTFVSLAGGVNGIFYGPQEADRNSINDLGAGFGAAVLPQNLFDFTRYTAEGYRGKMQEDFARRSMDPEIQAAYSITNLLRTPVRDVWLSTNQFLPMINNMNKCEWFDFHCHLEKIRRKNNFLKLKEAHYFASPEDGVVSPWQASHLGHYSDLASLEEIETKFETLAIVEMQDTLEYKEDTYGLRTEIIFLSNVDNLGAVVDLRILQHMMETNAEYIMELTNKTKADVKGGTIIDYEGSVRLLEIAQVPKEHVNEFKSIKKFKYFNTNNIWLNLKAIKRVVENDELEMEIIPNGKTIPGDKKGESDISIIQLETAVGAAIRHFNNAHGVNVPRRRFLPVKTCSDLMLVKSDLYTLKHGQLQMSAARFGDAPLIKLGGDFKKVSDFQKRIPSIPKVLELDHLTITGAVNLGRGVTLKGTVIIVATEGSTIDIPPGSILENVVVQGSLRLLEH